METNKEQEKRRRKTRRRKNEQEEEGEDTAVEGVLLSSMVARWHHPIRSIWG